MFILGMLKSQSLNYQFLHYLFVKALGKYRQRLYTFTPLVSSFSYLFLECLESSSR